MTYGDTRPAREVAVQALFGLVLGLSTALGHHYVVPRIYVDAEPPPDMSPTDVGYISVSDYLRHVDGPTWWPTVLVLPLLGALIGVACGLTHRYVSRRHLVSRAIGIVVATTVTGAASGGAGAIVSTVHPPVVHIVGVTDSSYMVVPQPDGASFDDTVVDNVPRLDVDAVAVGYTVTGGLLGALVGVALTYRRRQD
ncbi:hypothetical protein HQ312_19385 [Rhodococcus sp. BP-316]|uniref:transcription antitermination protein NusB n=1 Tax=Rhodococcus sp. BP-316 TaxID=2739445 RepID=UPI001C9B5A69|nr:transcription antitermination protein NusB [Rhodococcus sp. BP-316]MBY6683226.1 hypothetical protein [Rhodococcus sp. BP-316]